MANTRPRGDTLEGPPQVDPQQRSIGVPETTHWYGWQTLLVDGSAVLTVLMGGIAEDIGGGALALIGFGSFFLGTPILHAVRGNLSGAGISLLLRLGLPLLGVALGSQAEDCSDSGDSAYPSYCGLTGVAIGGAMGLVLAVVLDSAVIARENVQKEPARHACRSG